jgi:hypothetical protein
MRPIAGALETGARHLAAWLYALARSISSAAWASRAVAVIPEPGASWKFLAALKKGGGTIDFG